jgi:starch-binding outer membrane protein, SusD/RagB family
MKNKIILKFLAFFFTVIQIVSCDEQLEQKPITENESSKFYTTENELEGAVNATYSVLQFNGLYGLYIPAIGEIPSDNTFVEVPANDNGAFGELDEFTTITANVPITRAWKDSYIGIQRANLVLNRLDAVPYKDPAKKKSRTGEVTFIRALLYFNLVRIFGDVPLVTKETTNPNDYFGQGRTPKNIIYEQIIKDLSNAIPNLPSVQNQAGRVTRGAAQTLLGKVYLTLNQLNNAKQQLDAVVASGSYLLLSDLNRIFALDAENNREIIFAAQFASGLSGNTEGTTAFQQFSPSGTVSGAKGHNLPTKSLYSLYQAADLRKDAYIGQTKTGVLFSKKLKTSSVVQDSGSDWVILRYADVLLMLAEIENGLNNPSRALIYLNQIKTRAGLPPIVAINKDEIDTAIELERRLELIGEGHRWFDLIRTNKAIATMNAWFISQKINITIDANDLLFPIPQSQINTDPSIKQNPGYN